MLFHRISVKCRTMLSSTAEILKQIVSFYSDRRISQMTYQTKGVGKMVDFETLTLWIFSNQSKMCDYFCKDLVTGYCLYLVKDLFSTVIRFQIDFVTHTLLL